MIPGSTNQHPLLDGLMVIAAGFSSRTIDPADACPRQPQAARFVYCVHGKGSCTLGGRLHVIQRGDLLVLSPGVQATCHGHASDPWTIHWAVALGTRLPDYFLEMRVDERSPVIHPGDDPQIVRLFNEIARAMDRANGLIGILQASHALGYLLTLVIQKRQSNPGITQDTIRKVAESIIYLSEHLDQAQPVSTLARMASLSPAYFSELFKDQTGCSPRDYLHLLRMHQACELLRRTDLSVKEIAAKIGYQDPFHFSRQFKAFEGLAPRDYRLKFSG